MLVESDRGSIAVDSLCNPSITSEVDSSIDFMLVLVTNTRTITAIADIHCTLARGEHDSKNFAASTHFIFTISYDYPVAERFNDWSKVTLDSN